jgi:hypothetical protein
MTTNEAAIRSLRERFLDRPSETELDRYTVLADMAEAYVAKTLETISDIGAATADVGMNPVMAARVTEIQARIDGLGDLIVRLRELQAETGG